MEAARTMWIEGIAMSCTACSKFQARVLSKSVGLHRFRGSIPVLVGKDVSGRTRTQRTMPSRNPRSSDRASPILSPNRPAQAARARGDTFLGGHHGIGRAHVLGFLIFNLVKASLYTFSGK
jgi:hypothetical protein